FVEDRSEVLRIGIGNDLPLVAPGRQKRLDELGHARGFRTRQLDDAVLQLPSRDLGESRGHVVRRDKLLLGRRYIRRYIEDVPLRTTVRDRIEKPRELRRMQYRVRDAASFD